MKTFTLFLNGVDIQLFQEIWVWWTQQDRKCFWDILSQVIRYRYLSSDVFFVLNIITEVQGGWIWLIISQLFSYESRLLKTKITCIVVCVGVFCFFFAFLAIILSKILIFCYNLTWNASSMSLLWIEMNVISYHLFLVLIIQQIEPRDLNIKKQ